LEAAAAVKREDPLRVRLQEHKAGRGRAQAALRGAPSRSDHAPAPKESLMSWHRIPAILCLTAAALSMGACASAQGALRSQPSTHFTVEDFSPGEELDGLVTVRCAKISDAKYEASKAESAPKTSCRYVSADVTELAGLGTEDDSPLPAAALDLLLWISDYNCSNFLSRAYGVRSTFDLASKFIGDLATAASAGTVSVAPGVSVGLDVVNLLVGKANSNFDSQFYANATFDAMEAAISAERTKRKTEILARRATKPYSLAAALSDSRYYDDACSIKTGLQSLLDIARKADELQKAKNLAIQNVEPAKRADKLIEMQKSNQQR
jgi:hypothetical protein